MENIGWEIRPAGWVLLIVVLCLLIYYIANQLQDPSNNDQ
jgi:uncharacterized membrane protein